jgi:LytS/YehU family sensor histidine kinase
MRRHAYWICQILGWGGYSLLGAISATAQVGPTPEVLWGYGLYFVYSVALTHLLRRFVRRQGWLDRPDYLKLFLAAWITGLIQSALVLSVGYCFSPRSFVLRNAVSMIVGVSTVTLAWMTMYLAATSGRRAREKQLALRSAELRALEAQINPHFLFNCLNSIRGLVVENPPLAQDLITRLANILRYNLHRDAGHTVPLSSELEAAADYLAIEQARYEERLNVTLHVDPATQTASVPPMLVQTLVENAIKHGIAPLKDGGHVALRATAEDGFLIIEVENPGRIGERNGDLPALGLHNIRERLRLLYGGRASLDLVHRGPDRVAATVRIPRDV